MTASTDLTVMIDNYDSFTYNIVQYLSELGAHVHVVRNDAISLDELIALSPHRLVISPGPGSPSESGISCDAIKYFAGKIPILGVCLGHQSIIETFGGSVIRHSHIMHGKTSAMMHDGMGLFQNIKSPINATRYHSLVGDKSILPQCLEITCRCRELERPNNLTVEQFKQQQLLSQTRQQSESNGHDKSRNSAQDSDADGTLTLMGVRHKEFTIEGVQFHPESISTEFGHEMLANFLQFKGGKWIQ